MIWKGVTWIEKMAATGAIKPEYCCQGDDLIYFFEKLCGHQLYSHDLYTEDVRGSGRDNINKSSM